MLAAINEIFCSYAYEDRGFVESFRKHLRLMERAGLISSWYDAFITPGQLWRSEIEQHLQSANILLLFISPDFLNSDFCMDVELSLALERSQKKEALVIPIILRPVDWEDAPFAHLQALPQDGKPISTWQDQDEAFKQVAETIKRCIREQAVPAVTKCQLLNLPFRRNPIFTGREEVLEKLRAALQQHHTTALVQAISGLGGIGKTQIALEYTYRYQNDYLRVIWINAQSRETMVADVGKLARELNTLGCDDQDQAVMLHGFLHWLGRQQRWLLLLDNVEDLSLLREYIPAGNLGHILLTTRLQAVSGEIRRISIDEMTPETGGYFLLKRAKKSEADAALDTIPAEERLQANALSELLGGLPLALDQAGGFIERTGCSLNRYMQLYEKEHAHLLAEHGFPEETTKYAETVATTWSLSFERVAQAEEVGPAAADLLRMCAFLAADGISLWMFEGVAEFDFGIDILGSNLAPVAALPLQMEKAIEVLMRYSLLRREENVLSIHHLVQTVLRDAMSEKVWSLWAGRAIALMNEVFPDPQRVEFWPACQYLLPHTLVCYQWIVKANIQTEEVAKLLYRVGFYLSDQGLYREAGWLLKQTLEISRKVQGEEHPDTVASLNNLARLYRLQGRYEEAESLYKKALEISNKVLGEEHPSTALNMNNLASVYKLQGRYEEAEPLYKRALEISYKVLGEEHSDTAISLGNLASLYEAQGRYKEAGPLYKKALGIRSKALGEEHPTTAIFMNNLAGLYRLQGYYVKAESLYKKTLYINLKVLGNEHPIIATNMNNLAALYESQRRYEEAESLYKQSVEISIAMLGDEHPNIITSLDNLAGLYMLQERYEEAEPLREHVLKVNRKVLGEEHRDLALHLHNLAKLYVAQERYEEAEPLLEQAALILMNQLGKEHSLTKVFIENHLVCKNKRIKKQEE